MNEITVILDGETDITSISDYSIVAGDGSIQLNGGNFLMSNMFAEFSKIV